jgi:hypothetical protein
LPPSTIACNHAGWEFLKTRDPVTNELPSDTKAKELKYIAGYDRGEHHIKVNAYTAIRFAKLS